MHKISKETMDYRNKYASENYDRLNIQVPKGTKEPLKDYYKAQGHKSLNDYVAQLIKADLEKAIESLDENKRKHADLALYNILKKEQTERKETVDYIIDLGDGNTMLVEQIPKNEENRPE